MDYNFRARKKGKKWALVCEYKTADGTWKQKTKSGYLLKKDALAASEKKALLELLEKEHSIDRNLDGITLLEFYNIYEESRDDLSYNSKLAYRQAVMRMDKLINKSIKSITYLDLVDQFKSIKWASPTTESLTKTIIKSIFKQAVIFKAISRSPMSEYQAIPSSLKKQPPKRLRTFTKEEIQKTIDHASDNKCAVICCIMALTGMRIGEALGIRWDDIDFFGNKIKVDKQFKRIGTGIPIRYGFGAVKNKNGNRTLHMPPVLREVLLAYRGKSVLNIDGRITDIRHESAVSKWITKTFGKHSPHDYRHTFATRLCKSGADLKTIAAILGDTIGTIESTYLHYTEDMRRDADKRIDKIFG